MPEASGCPPTCAYLLLVPLKVTTSPQPSSGQKPWYKEVWEELLVEDRNTLIRSNKILKIVNSTL